MGRRSQGFTLVELAIVVAILGILMAVAVPTVRTAKKSASAAQAIGTLKTTFSVSEQYRFRYGVYASSETDLISSGLLPDTLSSPGSPYVYTYSSGPFTWQMNANPTVPGTTGDNFYFIDQSGVVRFDRAGPANASSAAVD